MQPPKVAGNISSTYFIPEDIENGKTYYWKIISWDNHGVKREGPRWSFTINSLPNRPYNPDPKDNATNVETTAILQWEGEDPDPEDIVTYDVHFGTNSSLKMMINNQTDTFYSIEILDYNSTYYWQIVAWDKYGLSAEGPLWRFTTEKDEIPPNVEIKKPLNYLYIRDVEIKLLRLIRKPILIGFIEIEVNASDNSNIDRVEFYIDNKLQYTDNEVPYCWMWKQIRFFEHSIIVRVYDETGNYASNEIFVWKFF